MNTNLLKTLLITAFAILLSACAQFSPNYETPEVHVTKIQPVAGEPGSIEQRFIIGLRILNPNDSDLNITGMSYNLTLQGIKVVSGVSPEDLSIPAYSEAAIDLQASTNLIGGFRAAMELLQHPDEPINYGFEIKLKTGFWPWPVSVVESGMIELNK